MCDLACCNEKKYALGPAPYFPLPNVKSYPCQAIEVDTPIYEPLVKPVIKNIVQETTINVPKIEYRENVVEIPKVEYRPYPVIKEVETPIFQDLYKYKDVVVPQKQYRIKPIYKEVDVPQVEYVDKYVKKRYKRFKYVPKEVQVPFRPRKEIYEEIPVPRYIPQHLESVIQPDHIIGQPEYVNHPVPFGGARDAHLIDVVSPIKPLKRSTPNKCCLSSLFSSPSKKYEADMPLPMPMSVVPPHLMNAENHLCDMYPNVGTYPYPPLSHLPHEYGIIGYSHPFIVEDDRKDLCNTLIETTANVLAASGVALILAGKLTYDGINYLVNISKKNKEKKLQLYQNSSKHSIVEESNESQQVGSGSGTPKSERTFSYKSNDLPLDD